LHYQIRGRFCRKLRGKFITFFCKLNLVYIEQCQCQYTRRLIFTRDIKTQSVPADVMTHRLILGSSAATENIGVLTRAQVPRNNTEIMNETTVAPPTTAAPPAHTAWPMTSSITTPVCYHTSGLQPTSSRASDASTIEAVDISDVTKQPTVQHLLMILLIPRHSAAVALTLLGQDHLQDEVLIAFETLSERHY